MGKLKKLSAKKLRERFAEVVLELVQRRAKERRTAPIASITGEFSFSTGEDGVTLDSLIMTTLRGEHANIIQPDYWYREK